MSTTHSPIRIGFVGLSASGGWAATALVPPLFQAPLSDKYKLVAVSTSNATSAGAAAKVFSERAGNHVKAYHDAADLANDPHVDLVAVGVKVPQHKAALLPALSKGKSVFSEWPLGRNLEEAKELAQLAKAGGVKTMVGLQGWQSPVTTKIREWIAGGKIGRVLGVTWIGQKANEGNAWGPYMRSGNEWYLEADNGATVLNIIVGHDMSQITRIFGPLETVSAMGGKSYPMTEVRDETGKPTGQTLPHAQPDHWAVNATFKDHPGAVLSARWRSISTSRPVDKHRPSLLVVIDGEDGVIKFEMTPSGPWTHLNIMTPSKVILNDEEVTFDEPPIVGNPGKNWEAFASGVDGSYATWNDAVVVHEYLAAIEKSAKEGRKIAFD
ncbi:NAD-binding Rossmann fold oxidoreductase [Auriculariales sp. MPI-PUGE-AT-0066]|nr:NAD-binding Rossmann fold oxidoreductase [Auriculariales sp. MPI-PUGE-AT-0066]